MNGLIKQDDGVSKKERIRGPEINVFIKYSEGVPFPEALKRADEKNYVILSSKRHDEILVKSEDWQKYEGLYPCWSGTMVCYVKPGVTFGKSKMFSRQDKAIVYTDSIERFNKQRYIFPVEDKYLEMKNSILVVEHPYFKLVNEGNDWRVVPELEKVGLVPNFPPISGWYAIDEEYGIPTGKEISLTDSRVRYLERINNKGRVGPVACGYTNIESVLSRMHFALNRSPSFFFGVAVEATTSEGRNVACEGTNPLFEYILHLGFSKKIHLDVQKLRLMVEGFPLEQLEAAVKLLEQFHNESVK